MPFPQDMVYIRWEFSWLQTAEIQDFGMWGTVAQEGAGPFQPWPAVTQAIADKAVSAWASEAGADNYSPEVKAVRAVAYHYDQPHDEVLDRAEAGFTGSNAWVGEATRSLPPQLSVVLSLYGYEPEAYTPQRARKRGRVYLPTPGASVVDGLGQLEATRQQTIADNSVDFLNAMTGVLSIPGEGQGGAMRWRPVVNSVAGKFVTPVGWIRVGKTIDTQRRRRNKLPEVYITEEINT